MNERVFVKHMLNEHSLNARSYRRPPHYRSLNSYSQSDRLNTPLFVSFLSFFGSFFKIGRRGESFVCFLIIRIHRTSIPSSKNTDRRWSSSVNLLILDFARPLHHTESGKLNINNAKINSDRIKVCRNDQNRNEHCSQS